MNREQKFISAYVLILGVFTGLSLNQGYKQDRSRASAERLRDVLEEGRVERDRIYVIDRGAEDDAAEMALSEHQEVNYVRCFLRPAGYVTCQVHTPPSDVEAQCRARGPRDFLVDGSRCRWTNPVSMAHP